MTPTCALCKSPATGLASIDDERFCHGDDDPTPTCYEVASQRRSGIRGTSEPFTIPCLECQREMTPNLIGLCETCDQLPPHPPSRGRPDWADTYLSANTGPRPNRSKP